MRSGKIYMRNTLESFSLGTIWWIFARIWTRRQPWVWRTCGTRCAPTAPAWAGAL